MKQEVIDGWIKWNELFEGRVPWMYVDVKRLVTTGVGNLIDPMSLALSLPWVVGGRPATHQEITEAWLTVKDRAGYLSKAGYLAAGPVTKLRLTNSAIDNLVMFKLRNNYVILSHTFKDIDNWPWQAQMALLSMAWALGPAFSKGWPKLTAALQAGDFLAAAAECKINEAGNPGVKPRNIANKQMFMDAGILQK